MIQKLFRSIRGSDSLETMLIMAVGISLLSTTMVWSYSRYKITLQGTTMHLMSQSAEKLYHSVINCYRRGDNNIYRINTFIEQGKKVRIKYNSTHLEVYYVTDNNLFPLLKKEFKPKITKIPAPKQVDIKSYEDIIVNSTGGIIRIAPAKKQ